MWFSYKESALPVPTVPSREAVHTAKIAEPPAKQEELSVDELSPKPASVKEAIRDRRMPPPKAPGTAKPLSEETPALLGEAPTESRLESKILERPQQQQRAGRAFSGECGPRSFLRESRCLQHPAEAL
jgi:hypothetical protein